MTAVGLLWACALAAAPGGPLPDEAGPAREGGGLGPKRDLFGTSRRGPEKRPDAPARLWGTVQLSDGERIEGRVSLAPGRPLEVYDLEAREWREFGLREIVELRAAPRREDLEREWRWKEYGKDEKVYTGRAYPRRWLDHELVVRAEGEKDGKGLERLSCHVRGAVLHLTTEPDKQAAEKVASEKTKPGERPATEIATDDTRRLATEVTENTEGERQRKGRLPVGGQAEAVPSETSETSVSSVAGRSPGVTSVASGRRGDEAPKRLRFVLRQYERGRLGQTLGDLVYVKRVTIHEGRRPESAGRRSAPPGVRPDGGHGKKRPGARGPRRPLPLRTGPEPDGR